MYGYLFQELIAWNPFPPFTLDLKYFLVIEKWEFVPF